MLARTPKKLKIDNIHSVYCINKHEVAVLQKQIETYFAHGISVTPGSVIFDLGANIGLFALRVLEMAGGHAQVYSFEPIPETYQALYLNAQGTFREKWHTFPVGIAAKETKETFYYYPNATMISSSINELQGDSIDNFVDLAQVNGKKIQNFPLFLRLFPSKLLKKYLRWMAKIFLKSQMVNCPLVPLSFIIDQEHISKIDLLKIDVEGGELDVFLGIRPEHWPLIKQVVLEIQDNNGQLNKAISILKSHNFESIITDQEPFYSGSNLYMVYAVRSK